MEQPVKILVVEDEMIIAANISLQLTEMGHEVLGIIPSGEDALSHIQNNLPDIVLIDIQLKGPLDGIETAIKMQEYSRDLAVIYLTANADDANFNRAKQSHPYAFLSKPFKPLDLQRSIELTISQLNQKEPSQTKDAREPASTSVLKDYLFVRHHESMIKIELKNILYVEADRNYCRIFSTLKEFLLVCTLKDIERSLPPKHFFRLHRSYIINLARIDEIAASYVVIAKKAIPMARGMRRELLKRLHTI
ncbi:response regulator transcription factor [Antarcticibacterium flavum]|uniref:Response regulator transcription factor n=2 Tax=Flavobacteriaceae TaxID=49546 RepID=A0A5B7X8C1_9FLAO|nr:DNA-binding response regulator [Antarcticibacterium sp. W02-3]QCY71375.1 response regulator transcription factor [Antarcticibacterium flavum]